MRPSDPSGAGRSLAGLVESARAALQAGDWDQALASYEAAFSRLPAEGSATGAAELLRWIGTVHRERGDLELAGELYAASLAVAEANGLTEACMQAVNCLGAVEQLQGRLADAERLYTKAQELADALGDELLGAAIDQNLGTLANIKGDLDRALLGYRSALERFRRIDNDLGAAWALNNMGMAYVDLGRWGEAEICFDAAFGLADRLRDAGTLGTIECNRSELYLKRRDFGAARECCDRAFEICKRLGAEAKLGEVYRLYGVLYRETGKPSLADAHLRDAVAIARRCGNRLLKAESFSEWALVHVAEERNPDALRCLNEAHRLFSSLHASRELLDLDRRLDHLEDTYLRVVRAWGESIESKDRYTAGHCERVANYACMLAEAVGIGGRDLTWLRMGGFLHDVGKIAVPAEVLNKPGRLTPEEWRVMQGHTVEGDEIVASLNFPWDIRPVVRSHHERWDGSGYPDGLAGDEIPLIARILCVADVFDALTTTRSYRPALQRDVALATMERDLGRIFDPHLFPIFRRLITAE